MNLMVSYSKKGYPCLTECGGGYTNTGVARIIADKNGYPKRAIRIFEHGDLACGDHAVIPVAVGDIIISADRHHDKVSVTVNRIIAVNQCEVEVEPCKDRICKDAINAAVEKTYDYHCRKPYYVRGL